MTDLGAKLYVSRFESEISESDLRELFEHYGEVLQIEMADDHSHAYVTFSESEDADLAMKSLHHMDFLGNELVISRINPHEKKKTKKVS